MTNKYIATLERAVEHSKTMTHNLERILSELRTDEVAAETRAGLVTTWDVNDAIYKLAELERTDPEGKPQKLTLTPNLDFICTSCWQLKERSELCSTTDTDMTCIDCEPTEPVPSADWVGICDGCHELLTSETLHFEEGDLQECLSCNIAGEARDYYHSCNEWLTKPGTHDVDIYLRVEGEQQYIHLTNDPKNPLSGVVPAHDWPYRNPAIG